MLFSNSTACTNKHFFVAIVVQALAGFRSTLKASVTRRTHVGPAIEKEQPCHSRLSTSALVIDCDCLAVLFDNESTK